MVKQQKTIKDLISLISKSSDNLNIVCVISGMIGLLLPFISIKMNIAMGMTQDQSFSGFSAAGWMAWITTFSFIILIFSNYIQAIIPYKNLIGNIVLFLIVTTIIYAWFFNPIKTEINNNQQQLNQLQQGFQQAFRSYQPTSKHNLLDALHTSPHIGMILFMISGIGLVFTRLKK